MQTTESGCKVSPVPKRAGTFGLLRILCGGLFALGLGISLGGCGNDVATDEAAISYEVNGMLAHGPSAIEEVYVYDGSEDVSVDPSTDPAGADPSGADPTTGCKGGPKPPPMPPPTPSCAKEKQGGPTSCKDEKTWRSYGEAYCKAKGLTLKGVTFATSCGRGDWREATFECCKSTPTPPPPPPPPPGPRCSVTKAGDGRACKDRATWKAEGAKFCASKWSILTVLTLEDRCGMDSFKTASFECCGWTPPPPPPPPPPPMCFSAGAGGPGVCKADADWKAEAEKACAAKKMTLKGITYGTACTDPRGTRGHSDVKYECCPGTPPPPPPMCTTERAASMTCKADANWKAEAEKACAAKMMTLKGITYGTACMGGHLNVSFECCPGTPPPPPPMCTKDRAASMTCKADATWKMEAEKACAAKMMTLKGITYGTACMGGHSDITYECCPGSPPPPPPTCTTDLVGGAGICRTDADWKTAAEAFCKMKGSTLKNLTFGAACTAMGVRGYSEAKIECCK